MGRVLLIGSGNKDKRAELEHLLQGTSWDVKSLKDFEPVEEPEETEDTFAGNALLKARYYGGKFGVACVSDDSGIEVDALDGAPGIYSARYAGPDARDGENLAKLMKELYGVPEEQRSARFRCVLCLIDPEGFITHYEGICEGRIDIKQQGSEGFGYDPAFIPDGYQQSFGELGEDVKSKLSHRAIAVRWMREVIDELEL